MEPGGFEPPCRYSHPVASTRVSAVPVSDFTFACSGRNEVPGRQFSYLAEVCQPLEASPIFSILHPIGRRVGIVTAN